MLLIYSLQALLLAGAMLLLAFPFIRKQQSLFSRQYLGAAFSTLVFASFLSVLLSDHKGLNLWFAGGKQHYQLLETFNEMGGADGAINSLLRHLNTHPADGKAWFLLGKLYLGKQDIADAKIAFGKAHQLIPADTEITEYYEYRA
jgi:tetratricopeptide (TPR) repeat protein